jgi:hypothetical protein
MCWLGLCAGLPDDLELHHIIVNDWERGVAAEQNVVLVSIASVSQVLAIVTLRCAPEPLAYHVAQIHTLCALPLCCMGHIYMNNARMHVQGLQQLASAEQA